MAARWRLFVLQELGHRDQRQHNLMVVVGWVLVGVGALTMAAPAAAGRAKTAWRDRDPEPLVRIGVASIFLVNAAVAFVNPDDFGDVLRANALGQHLSDDLIRWSVVLAGVNDLLLGLALLIVRNRYLLIGWMAAWLLVVAVTKAMNLIW